MNRLTFTPPWSDEAIVAWLDGEMHASDAQRFEQELADNAALAQRVALLQPGHDDFAAAFAPLLDDAPQERMERRLQGLLPPVHAPQPGYGRRALIAASVGFLLAGSAIGWLARPPSAETEESQQLRDLEARYMSLYDAETLADSDSAPALLQRGLERTRRDLGLQVSQRQLALPDAELKMVRILRYEHTAIAQIAWLHTDSGPLALCISAERHDGSSTIHAEQRHGMHLAWWNHQGYQYVLIGRAAESQLAGLARTLQSTLSGSVTG